MLTHIIEFFIYFFTNLSLRKIIGAVLAFTGLNIIQSIGTANNLNTGVLYMLGGLALSGIGLAIIYIDIARDKNHLNNSDLELITKAYEQKPPTGKKSSGWHMDDSENNEDSSASHQQPKA